jgi:hypothetical protein
MLIRVCLWHGLDRNVNAVYLFWQFVNGMQEGVIDPDPELRARVISKWQDYERARGEPRLARKRSYGSLFSSCHMLCPPSKVTPNLSRMGLIGST